MDQFFSGAENVACANGQNQVSGLSQCAQLLGNFIQRGAIDGIGNVAAKIGGRDAAWQLGVVEGEAMVDINYLEEAMDPAGRLTLEMIPFSQYK